MNDLIFEVTQEEDGGFVAKCLTESIVTQGDDWNALKIAVDEAVRGFFFDDPIISFSTEQIKEIDCRLDSLETEPKSGILWSTVRDGILATL